MIRNWLTAHGYALPGADFFSQIDRWRAWYQGFVPAFHRYWVHNGQKRRRCERYRLNMARSVCAEHAKLLLNDRVRISCGGFEELDALLAEADFFTQGNRLIELVFALGTGAFTEYLGADGRPCIDYVRGDMIFPLKWRGSTVTDCAFASRVTVGGRLGWYIQLHEKQGWQYIIRNVYLDAQGKEVSPPDGIAPQVATGSARPLFQLIRPARVNNVDLDCPMGAAIYSDAIDQLKGCDFAYDSFVNEIQLGRARLMVPQSMATIEMQKNGLVEPRFDPNDATFYVYEQSADGKQELKHVIPPLRMAEHEKAVQMAVDLLAFKCDLGRGRFRFENGTIKTAREVIAQNSDLYQSIKRNEKVIESAIFDMVKALGFLTGLQPDKLTPAISFDESIFEDAEAIASQNVMLVNAGLRTRKDAIMAIEQVDEGVALKKAEAIAKEQNFPAPTTFMED